MIWKADTVGDGSKSLNNELTWRADTVGAGSKSLNSEQ